MHLGIVGHRDFTNYETFVGEVEKFSPINAIVTGGAKGADSLAIRYARENKIPHIVHLPKWKKFGKAAGPIRNKLIVEDSDLILAFLAPGSKGTADTIKQAREAQKKVFIVEIER